MNAASFHVMAKPTGAICNLNCHYCYYLEKERLYPAGETFRMAPAVLETFISQYIASQKTPEITFAWQGGEPTLLGLDFFREVVRLQSKHSDGRKISNAIQTNGTLLNDSWCSFFTEHDFLVGLSIDGPQHLHDANRPDKGGHPSFGKVMRGLACLRKHGTNFNTLTVVSRTNARQPLEVYRFLKEIGSAYLQFIPLVERVAGAEARAMGLDHAPPPESLSGRERTSVTPESVDPREFGSFLLAVFDEWVRSDVGRVFVQLFDATLAGWMGLEPPLCVFAETCGNAMALEHNGDLFSCDHYVYPNYRLGNILETPMAELASSPVQLTFGRAKRDSLPRYCRKCEVRLLCNGECPKHRFIATPDGEPGLNYLCAGYKSFFTSSAPYFQGMAELLRNRRPPADIMLSVAARDREEAMKRASRNDPCPCGTGKKFKNCCGSRPRET